MITLTLTLQAMLDEVKAAGYEMHAVCLWAPLSVTRSRGEERSVGGKGQVGRDSPLTTGLFH